MKIGLLNLLNLLLIGQISYAQSWVGQYEYTDSDPAMIENGRILRPDYSYFHSLSIFENGTAKLEVSFPGEVDKIGNTYLSTKVSGNKMSFYYLRHNNNTENEQEDDGLLSKGTLIFELEKTTSKILTYWHNEKYQPVNNLKGENLKGGVFFVPQGTEVIIEPTEYEVCSFTFVGALAGKTITMCFYPDDSDGLVNGTYYYGDGKGGKIHFTGKATQQADGSFHQTLTELNDKWIATGHFVGTLKKGLMTGTWTSADSKRSFKYQLALQKN